MNDEHQGARTERAVVVGYDATSTKKPPAVAPGLPKDEVERRLRVYGTTAPDWGRGGRAHRYSC